MPVEPRDVLQSIVDVQGFMDKLSRNREEIAEINLTLRIITRIIQATHVEPDAPHYQDFNIALWELQVQIGELERVVRKLAEQKGLAKLNWFTTNKNRAEIQRMRKNLQSARELFSFQVSAPQVAQLAALDNDDKTIVGKEDVIERKLDEILNAQKAAGTPPVDEPRPTPQLNVFVNVAGAAPVFSTSNPNSTGAAPDVPPKDRAPQAMQTQPPVYEAAPQSAHVSPAAPGEDICVPLVVHPAASARVDEHTTSTMPEGPNATAPHSEDASRDRSPAAATTGDERGAASESASAARAETGSTPACAIAVPAQYTPEDPSAGQIVVDAAAPIASESERVHPPTDLSISAPPSVSSSEPNVQASRVTTPVCALEVSNAAAPVPEAQTHSSGACATPATPFTEHGQPGADMMMAASTVSAPLDAPEPGEREGLGNSHMRSPRDVSVGECALGGVSEDEAPQATAERTEGVGNMPMKEARMRLAMSETADGDADGTVAVGDTFSGSPLDERHGLAWASEGWPSRDSLRTSAEDAGEGEQTAERRREGSGPGAGLVPVEKAEYAEAGGVGGESLDGTEYVGLPNEDGDAEWRVEYTDAASMEGDAEQEARDLDGRESADVAGIEVGAEEDADWVGEFFAGLECEVEDETDKVADWVGAFFAGVESADTVPMEMGPVEEDAESGQKDSEEAEDFLAGIAVPEEPHPSPSPSDAPTLVEDVVDGQKALDDAVVLDRAAQLAMALVEEVVAKMRRNEGAGSSVAVGDRCEVVRSVG